MAEASAKMHLREYVRVDDVDLAISVAVGSFLSAQKLSVRRSLERVGISVSSYFLFTYPPDPFFAFL
jgi:DNA replicative helicase MCM subunit Mcm2 (Cdc46/Mcm family)